MRYLSIFLFLITLTFFACQASKNNHLYRAKSGSNTPYSDDRDNNQSLKDHQKAARKRQAELDHINKKDIHLGEEQRKEKKQ